MPRPLNQAALLAWFAERGRDLPWRQTRDPWAVLVSEVMLQQTQAARVEPRWRALLARWPDPEALAAAPLAEVLRQWQGLGYPRRAKRLWEAARMIVERHGGRVPRELSALLELPGVGDYTARAVLAFAFEREVAVLDTHVGRVLARTAGRSLTRSEAQAVADDAVPEGQGWAWNQAMLDLGAMVCTARRPACGACPVRSGCAHRGEGPDPALTSAATSRRQPRFEGSDRQLRGRLLAAVGDRGPLAADALWSLAAVGGDVERARVLLTGLADDGLVERRPDGLIALPGDPAVRSI